MKVCLKAAAVTQQDSYFTIQTDSVPIRIWFLTDQILRIRAGFDGDFAEESYSLVTTAWEKAYHTGPVLSDGRRG